jgi:predicted glycosyltransferase
VRILFDIAHPAHVHFFKNIVSTLSKRGHAVHILARKKDVTTVLLDRLGFDYDVTGQSGRKGWFGQGRELIERDLAVAKLAHRFRADMIVTRNPAGAQAARLLGVRSVFDTDDGRAAGVHFWAAASFAHVITTPDCIGESYGRRHVPYAGYKQTAYLHPAHFKPNPQVLEALGVEPGQRLFMLRFVDMVASHDTAETGLPKAALIQIADRLRRHGKVVATHESQLPEQLRDLSFPLSPDKLHDVLAFCDLLVGDSQTMAAEAAVLGTPSLRISTWAGRLAILDELEQRYGLTAAYHPRQLDAALARLDSWLEQPRLRDTMATQHHKLLNDKIDVAAWFSDFIEAGAPLGHAPR